MVPLMAPDTVRSNTGGPGMPRGPSWMCATVAGDFRPVYVPLIARRVPVSAAVTAPHPAIVLCIATSIGTVERRARYCPLACAARYAGPAAIDPSKWKTNARRRMRGQYSVTDYRTTLA